jgi:hypothetical protein
MLGELGGPPHGQPTGGGGGSGGSSGPVNTGGSAKLISKNYYELHMRVLEDVPSADPGRVSLQFVSVMPKRIAAASATAGYVLDP